MTSENIHGGNLTLNDIVRCTKSLSRDQIIAHLKNEGISNKNGNRRLIFARRTAFLKKDPHSSHSCKTEVTKLQFTHFYPPSCYFRPLSSKLSPHHHPILEHSPDATNQVSHPYRGTDKATLLFINPLKTKRRLLYLKTQFVPRSKHFSSRL